MHKALAGVGTASKTQELHGKVAPSHTRQGADSLVDLASAQTLSRRGARQEDADFLWLKALDQRLKRLACRSIIEIRRNDFQKGVLQDAARRLCKEVYKRLTPSEKVGMELAEGGLLEPLARVS